MDKIKEILESLNIEATDEMLEALSQKFADVEEISEEMVSSFLEEGKKKKDAEEGDDESDDESDEEEEEEVEVKESEEVVEESVELISEDEINELLSTSIEEDVDVLFDGTELSEEFREKTRAIFESAVAAKAKGAIEKLAERYESALEEQQSEFRVEMEESASELREELVETIGKFADHVAEEFVKKNELQIENGLKLEIAESVLGNIKQVFEENNLNISDEEQSVVEELKGELEESRQVASDLLTQVSEMKDIASAMKKELLIKESSEGLADTQVEKLAELCEGVEFELGQESAFLDKVAVLKKSYFKESASPEGEQDLVEETTETNVTGISESVAAASAFLSRMNRKY